MNCGPLLYHYTDVPGEISIELSWEEVKCIILKMGFEIKAEKGIKSRYAGRGKTLMEVVYNCVYFEAIKPIKS